MFESQYILSIALGQGILLAFFILSSKYYKSEANTWLAIALFLLSVICITDVLASEYNPSSMFVEFFVHDLELGFLVYIPLYYFFSISTQSKTRVIYQNNYLFLPFVIDTLINLIIVQFYTPEMVTENFAIQIFYEIETLAMIFFALFLGFKSYQRIKAYEGDADKKNWIHKVWLSTIILLIAWLLLTFSGYLMGSALSSLVLALYLFISLWMFWLIYNGIVNLKLIDDRKNINLKLQRKSFQKSPEVERIGLAIRAGVEQGLEKVSGSKQKINTEVINGHFEKINHLIVSESLYRNEDLGIEDVAKRIDMSTGYVSKIIKGATQKNFPIWINEFRVEEAKAMFIDPDFNNYTTLSIGLEAGFKSKSAFYAAFKKVTGESPAKFRKKTS
ncbi:MAG: AraC family transcriptional regulator [Bacteroidota bacterium]